MKHQGIVKKQLVAIDIHSFIDVITNSSTELFVCMDNKAVENIKEILDASEITGYKEPFVFSFEEFKKNKDDYNSDYHMLDGWFYDDLDPNLIDNKRKEFISHEPWGYNIHRASDKGYWRDEFRKVHYDERYIIVNRVFDEIKNNKIPEPYWWEDPISFIEHEDPMSLLEGKVIILGDGDNSIPWDDVERIERIFCGRRYHLG